MNAAYVAVVDDEAPVRTALRRLLHLADYDVSTFASGEEFLESIPGHRPDCVLLDVHMPGLTGFQVQEKMLGSSLDMPVIFITANEDRGIDEAASRAGCVCVLHKPFSNDTLLAAVFAALHRFDSTDPGTTT